MPFPLRLLLPLLLLAGFLTGCGYKGALYLPDKSPDQAGQAQHNPLDGV